MKNEFFFFFKEMLNPFLYRIDFYIS